jgi:glycosyltransferase involved in cell wall biosynthesis
MKLSVISPVYRAEGIVTELVEQLSRCLESSDIDYEIILVEDGSKDNSWNEIVKSSQHDTRVKGIKLSRNFGQHYAVSAGLDAATGTHCAIIDCDLQDYPDSILLMLDEMEKGFDVVFSKRKKRHHGFFKSKMTILYHFLFRVLVGNEFDINLNSLVLMKSSVRDQFVKLKDYDRLYIQLLKWVGFKSGVLEVDHRERYSGKSTYSFSALLKIAIQGWTFHSDRLLRLSIYGGFFMSGLSFIGGLTIVAMYFLRGFQAGWPSVILSIIFSSGLILVSIGIVGLYVGKIFSQVKGRPLYVIEKQINVEHE